MRRLVVSPPARRAFKSILAQSRKRFGFEIEQRYRWLFIRAFADLRADPARRSVRAVGNGVLLYHLRHSRNGLASADRIARPRHLIAFRHDEEEIVIIQLLYDGMDLSARLQ